MYAAVLEPPSGQSVTSITITLSASDLTAADWDTMSLSQLQHIARKGRVWNDKDSQLGHNVPKDQLIKQLMGRAPTSFAAPLVDNGKKVTIVVKRDLRTALQAAHPHWQPAAENAVVQAFEDISGAVSDLMDVHSQVMSLLIPTIVRNGVLQAAIDSERKDPAHAAAKAKLLAVRAADAARKTAYIAAAKARDRGKLVEPAPP